MNLQWEVYIRYLPWITKALSHYPISLPKLTKCESEGYYIKLLLIAENNTIPLTNIGIANKLGISKNTVPQYNIELFQAGLLKLFPDRLELTPNELLISNDEAKQKKEWHPITGDLLPNINSLL